MRFKQYLKEEQLDEGLASNILFTILGSVFSIVSLPLSAEAKESLKDQLARHEGLKYTSYTDTVGKKTIGIGFNIDDNSSMAKKLFKEWKLDYDKVYKGEQKLNDEQVKKLFEINLNIAKEVAKKYLSNFDSQPEEVKEVIINMAFNLGNKLYEFKKTKELLEKKQYKNASAEMLKSDWAKQVGNRAKELAGIIARQK